MVALLRKERLCRLDYIKDDKTIKPHNLTDKELEDLASKLIGREDKWDSACDEVFSKKEKINKRFKNGLKNKLDLIFH
jgi:hypothetical protein